MYWIDKLVYSVGIYIGSDRRVLIAHILTEGLIKATVWGFPRVCPGAMHAPPYESVMRPIGYQARS